MKTFRKIISLLALVLFVLTGHPVQAEENTFFQDQDGYLTASELVQLNLEAQQVLDETGLAVMAVFDESYASSIRLAQDIAAGAPASDGIVLALNASEWYMYPFGQAADVFTEEDIDAIWAKATAEPDNLSAMQAYMQAAKEVWLTGSVTQPAMTPVPSGYRKPRVVDDADLLTYEEEQDLLKKLDEISERQNMDVVVVTTNSLYGQDVTAYADDFYDYNGYWEDGILLLISMEDRDWALSTKGFGITAFTDKGMEEMMKKVTPALSTGSYYNAFETYADLCDQYITQAVEGDPYDVGNLPAKGVQPFWLPLAAAIGAAFGFGSAGHEKSKLKSVRRQRSATSYLVPGSLDITHSQDHYLFSRTSRVARPKNTSSRGGGGSSTHISSSGSFHGGSHGKF